MKNFVLVPVLGLVVFILADGILSHEVVASFKEHGIVPDVIAQAPLKEIQVKYPKSGKEVKLGVELAPKEVKDQPDVSFDAEPNSFYTLVMTDPDAPSRKTPTSREWQHWLVVNIPGAQVDKGEVLSEYVGSGPPKDTGLHRYVLLVYKQPGKVTFQEPRHSKTDGKRAKFSVQKFATKYQLGEPIAGNFFQAQFDDSVPALHKSLH